MKPGIDAEVENNECETPLDVATDDIKKILEMFSLSTEVRHAWCIDIFTIYSGMLLYSSGHKSLDVFYYAVVVPRMAVSKDCMG